MATLKEMAATAKIVTQVGLEQALTELKTYIDAQDTAGSSAASTAIAALDSKLDALIGAEGGDVDKLINTFNEIKEFLSDYSEDDTLKSLLDAIDTAISTAETNLQGLITAEQTRAQNAETALSGRITTIENINIMSAAEATAVFDGVFHPTPAQGN